ncbi:hypothetical protein [Erythrobacter alti]|uniref:hypothetical protein n=1 Tax=Erythrobacter alti TaxID=1896145 RepID=UPI0030F374BA
MAEPEQFDEDDQESARRTGKFVWIALGLVAAIALAAFGGKMLGEFAGLSQGEVTAVDGSQAPAPTDEPSAPVLTPVEPDLPPTDPTEVNIATSLAPDSGIRAIGMGEWLRQEDFPRELFGGEPVNGVIAAYLTVVPEGSVTRCTIGSSSEVEPQRFLRPAAVGVCRALRERARFEPYAAAPRPTISPVAVPTATSSDPKQEADPAQQNSPTILAAPPVDEREVFVRVAFRTAQPPAASE